MLFVGWITGKLNGERSNLSKVKLKYAFEQRNRVGVAVVAQVVLLRRSAK